MKEIEESLKISLLEEARKRLHTGSFDVYHTLQHHQEVFENCKDIATNESLDVNMDLVEVACYWHDVFKGSEDEESQLKETLLSLGMKSDDANKVVEIIAEHSFGKVQTSNESKLLYDADKIELVSITRWERAFDAYNRKEIDLATRDRYIKEWNRRMPLLENHLHFNFSNQIFSRNLREFKEWLKSIGRLDVDGNFISELN